MKMLEIWPQFPIIINKGHVRLRISDVANIIAALEQHNRVCKINLGDIPSWALETISAAMEVLFPALTHLWLDSEDKNPAVLGNSFLGGSAPSLRCIRLNGIPFPALPHLLLSTHDLVVLHLENIPQSGYISPKAMVAGLSALSRLKQLSLEFQSPRSRADRESYPPPLTPVILPALTKLWFRGDSEYLGDIVSQIDTPLLVYTQIEFFH
jgi:hypothetical protein